MTTNCTPKAAFMLAFTLGAALSIFCPRIFAQGNPPHGGNGVGTAQSIHADAAKLVYPPNVPMSQAAMFKTQSPPFRPTMSADAYAAAKLAASADFGSKPGGIPGIRPNTAGSIVKFKGLDENGSVDDGATSNRSECSAAVGVTQYAEVTNDAFAVYTRTGTLLKTTPLSALFNYTAEPMYDPSVKYDPVWNRWIVTATSAPESSTTQYLHFAFSQTDNANGLFWISETDVAINSGDNWDDEQTGLTQDAVLFDANVYNGGTYRGATFFSVAKASLYNGRAWDVPAHEGLNGTLTLPVVMDEESSAYLMYDVPGTSNVGIYTVTNAANGFQGEALSAPVVVNVPDASFAVPPAAAQPGTKSTLDTLDARFTGNSVQLSGTIYAVGCVGTAGFPICQAVLIYYTSSPVSTEVEPFYVSATSDDFNPSVAVDYSGDLAVEWNSTDPTSGQQVSIYANAVPAGSTLPENYGDFVQRSTLHFGRGDVVQPWGACSSLSLDPVDGATWWGTNQLTETVESWKTENFHFVTQ